VLGDYGSFVIALMPQAPLHKEAVLKLAKAEGPKFWEGIAIDEIRRPGKGREQPRALHFGFASTKSDTRTEWESTEPSENPVDYEDTGLSHFPGAVAARHEADDKSCADRFWINVDDWAMQDGETVVFAYVVEGLETLERACEATMSAQEEELGQGRPEENIRITAVEVVE
jgi:cyclophilin family peptidyl-prolyl cis-trans isomerase